MPRLRHPYAPLILAVSLLLSGCGLLAGDVPPTPTPLPPRAALEMPTYTVRRGDVVQRLAVSARVSPLRQDDLFFARAGKVARLLVRQGDRVRKGQLLGELEQSDLNNQLEQARLALGQAKLKLDQSQRRKRSEVRLAELDLKEAKLKLDAARGGLARQLAEIGVERARINLQLERGTTDEELSNKVAQAQLSYDRVKGKVDAGRLYAPYDGVVSSVAISPGDNVEAYQRVVTVMDTRGKVLDSEPVRASDLASVAPHQSVTIHFNHYPNATVRGVVARVPQPGDSDTSLTIRFDPGRLQLDYGDLAEVDVSLKARRDVLWLPPEAIRSFEGRRFVVVQEGKRQRRVDVTLGIASSDRVEIRKGLREGQVVVGQ